MAVNGVEIKVGQKWRTRGGNFVVVYGSSGCLNRPWRIYSTGGMYWVTDEGFTQTSMNPTYYDLIALNNKPNETQQERFAAADETAGHIDSGLKMLSEYEKAERDSAFVESLAVKWTSGGAKLERKSNYYQVQIDRPVDPQSDSYLAECADIIEALNMTFNEGEAFKALWRLAAARQGRTKAGGNPIYDADKVAHYGARTAAHTRAQHTVAK